MSFNKIILSPDGENEETVLDLTQDTVTPQTLASGITAHDNSGNIITGTLSPGGGLPDVSAEDNNKVLSVVNGEYAVTNVPQNYVAFDRDVDTYFEYLGSVEEHIRDVASSYPNPYTWTIAKDSERYSQYLFDLFNQRIENNLNQNIICEIVVDGNSILLTGSISNLNNFLILHGMFLEGEILFSIDILENNSEIYMTLCALTQPQ